MAPLSGLSVVSAPLAFKEQPFVIMTGKGHGQHQNFKVEWPCEECWLVQNEMTAAP